MSFLPATWTGPLARLIGLHTHPADLTLLQMSLRAGIVFMWGVAIVRWGDRRALGRNAGFDMLLVVILGSVLSRAVNGQSAFFPTLGVSAVLILLHHVLALATSRSDFFSKLIKGTPRVLVRDGKVQSREMRRSRLTPDDLQENLRLNGNVADLSRVREARLERNGSVSVISRDA